MWIQIAGRGRSLPCLVGVLAVLVSAGSAMGAGAAFAPSSDESPPVGHYGCVSVPVATPVGSGYGSVIYKNRVPEGDVWIYSDHEYAGPNFKNDVGTYEMDGRTLVAKTGAFAPPGPRTRVTFTPAHDDDKASLYIVYFDNEDQPSRASECVWSDSMR